MKMKSIGFTGDYSQLKKMGFEFQKLYAGNYMQWCHNESDVRIWKKGADVTISSMNGMEGQVLQMMIDGVKFKTRTYGDRVHLTMYKNEVTNTLSLDEDAYVTEGRAQMAAYKNTPPEDYVSKPRVLTALYVKLETMNMLQTLGKLGWIHVEEYDGEHLLDDDYALDSVA